MKKSEKFDFFIDNNQSQRYNLYLKLQYFSGCAAIWRIWLLPLDLGSFERLKWHIKFVLKQL